MHRVAKGPNCGPATARLVPAATVDTLGMAST